MVLLLLQIILKNGSLRNRVNLHYKKTADSILLSLFMRTNGKCNNSHDPYYWLKPYSAFRQNSIFLKDQNMKKISTLYRCKGRTFTNSTQKQRQQLRFLNNLSNILMESATILTTPAAVFFCLSEPNIPEGPEYENISTLYRCTIIWTHLSRMELPLRNN